MSVVGWGLKKNRNLRHMVHNKQFYSYVLQNIKMRNTYVEIYKSKPYWRKRHKINHVPKILTDGNWDVEPFRKNGLYHF